MTDLQVKMADHLLKEEQIALDREKLAEQQRANQASEIQADLANLAKYGYGRYVSMTPQANAALGFVDNQGNYVSLMPGAELSKDKLDSPRTVAQSNFASSIVGSIINGLLNPVGTVVKALSGK